MLEAWLPGEGSRRRTIHLSIHQFGLLAWIGRAPVGYGLSLQQNVAFGRHSERTANNEDGRRDGQSFRGCSNKELVRKRLKRVIVSAGKMVTADPM